PGAAYFANATNAITSVSLIATGTYVLRLAVNDGEFTGFDDITLTVLRPTNQPPFVFAGPDLEVTRPQPAQLLGTVTDDDLPLVFPLTLQWSKVSGPGTVTFSPNVSSLLAQATFNVPGVYVLQLTANDTQFTNSGIVTITVHEGINAPPVV